MKQRVRWAWVGSLLLAACGGSGTSGPNPPPPAPVASVTVQPDSSSVAVAGTRQLTATLRDAGGATLSGRSVAWSSSEPAVASVSTSGLVTAVTTGRAVISASSEGKTGTAVVRVPADTLPVAANLPAVSAIPLRVPVVRPEDYNTTNPDLPGMPVSFNTVVISIAADATAGQVNALLTELEAQLVGGVPGVAGQAPGLLIVRLKTKTHAELAPVLSSIRGKPFVRTATADVLLSDLAVPRPPTDANAPFSWGIWDVAPSGANWSLEAMRVPQAWNLNDVIRHASTKTATGIYDAGFGANSDLVYARTLDQNATDGDHGTHVAGTVAATFDNRIGVDGVNPFAELTAVGNATASYGHFLAGLSALMSSFPDLRVINVSIGYNWQSTGVSPAQSASARSMADQDGSQVRDILAARAAVSEGKLPVIVAAAGNDSKPGTDEQARYGSALTNAALAQGVAAIIVVEAVQFGTAAARAPFSELGGHVSAPGVSIMSTLPGNRYGSDNGTSMAAPHVTALIGFLYALDPSLPAATMSTNPLRDLLIATATPVSGGAAPMVDAFAATLAVDGLAGGEKVLRGLVDIDDGTPDGNLRVAADGSPFVNQDADGNGTLGDGNIDMSDFRRWRDWLLEIEQSPLRELDGAPDHIKRDLNGDKLVSSISVEAVFPRGDFNGDGVMDRVKRVRVPGVMGNQLVTDLEVLQKRFSDPDYNASELPGLLDSGDISVEPSRCLAVAGVATVRSAIRVTGEDAELKQYTHTSSAATHIYTMVADPGLYTVHLDAFDASGSNLIGSAEHDFATGLGKDDHWDPVCVGLDLSVDFPTQATPGVATPLSITAKVRDPASAPAAPRSGIKITILAVGGSVAAESGLTDGDGKFSTTATLEEHSSLLTLTVTADLGTGVTRTVIVQVAPGAPTVTGTFSGSYTSTMTPTSGGGSFQGTFSITFQLVQTGSAVSGTWTSSSGCSGPVSAVRSGNNLFNWSMLGNCVDSQGHPYNGSWVGSAIVSSDGGTITATFNGATPFHSFTNGTAIVTRTSP